MHEYEEGEYSEILPPEFADRSRIIREIHTRAPLSCGEFVRASRLTVIHPSFKERFRASIRRQLTELRENGEPNYRLNSVDDVIRAMGLDLLHGETGGGQSPAHLEEIRKRHDLIDSLLRCAADEAKKEVEVPPDETITRSFYESGAQQKARMWLKHRMRQLANQTPENGLGFTARYPHAETDIVEERLRGAELEDQLDPILKDQKLSRVELHWRWTPSTEGVAGQPDDVLNDPEDCPVERHENYRLRTRWEGYAHSQNFSVFEDFSSSGGEGERTQVPPIYRFELEKYDALSTFTAAMSGDRIDHDDDRIEHRVKFLRELCGERNVGQNDDPDTDYEAPESGILAAANYWIAPAEFILDIVRTRPGADRRISGVGCELLAKRVRTYTEDFDTGDRMYVYNSVDADDRDRAEEDVIVILNEIADWAKTWFRIGATDERTPPSALRDDFVFCFAAGGRAILVSDLRPDRNDSAHRRTYNDYASRTLIIDLGMNAEQRGRLVSRLMDLATFRHLALRGQPYVNAAIDTLTQVGKSLSLLARDRLEAHPEYGSGKKKIVAEIAEQAKKLRATSTVLDRLNLFFTYGVSAKRTSTDVYSEQIQQILAQAREHRIAGWQTLGEYMQRYFAAAGQIGRLANRYETLRARVSGATDLIQAELSTNNMRKLADEAVSHTRVMIGTGVAAFLSAIGGISAAFTAHWSYEITRDQAERALLDPAVLQQSMNSLEVELRELREAQQSVQLDPFGDRIEARLEEIRDAILTSEGAPAEVEDEDTPPPQ